MWILLSTRKYYSYLSNSRLGPHRAHAMLRHQYYRPRARLVTDGIIDWRPNGGYSIICAFVDATPTLRT